jgi:hypothetical protein
MPSANIDALFPYTPFVAQARITDTTTDKSGATTANIKTLYTAEAFGDKVSWIKFKHVGTSITGTFLIWITDTAGANPRLHSEQAFTGVASSATVATVEYTFGFDDLELDEGQEIWVACTTHGSDVDVNGQIGKYQKP